MGLHDPEKRDGIALALIILAILVVLLVVGITSGLMAIHNSLR